MAWILERHMGQFWRLKLQSKQAAKWAQGRKSTFLSLLRQMTQSRSFFRRSFSSISWRDFWSQGASPSSFLSAPLSSDCSFSRLMAFDFSTLSANTDELCDRVASLGRCWWESKDSEYDLIFSSSSGQLVRMAESAPDSGLLKNSAKNKKDYK